MSLKRSFLEKNSSYVDVQENSSQRLEDLVNRMRSKSENVVKLQSQTATDSKSETLQNILNSRRRSNAAASLETLRELGTEKAISELLDTKLKELAREDSFNAPLEFEKILSGESASVGFEVNWFSNLPRFYQKLQLLLKAATNRLKMYLDQSLH